MYDVLSTMSLWRKREQLNGLQDRHNTMILDSVDLKPQHAMHDFSSSTTHQQGAHPVQTLNSIAVHPSEAAVCVGMSAPFGGSGGATSTAAEFGLFPLRSSTSTTTTTGHNAMDEFDDSPVQNLAASSPANHEVSGVDVTRSSWVQMPAAGGGSQSSCCSSLAWMNSNGDRNTNVMFVGSNRGKVHCILTDPEECGDGHTFRGEWRESIATLKLQPSDDLIAKRVPSASSTAPTSCVSSLQLSRDRQYLLGVCDARLAIWNIERALSTAAANNSRGGKQRPVLPSRLATGSSSGHHSHNNRKLAASWVDTNVVVSSTYGTSGGSNDNCGVVELFDTRTSGMGHLLSLGRRDVHHHGTASFLNTNVLAIAPSPIVSNWLLTSHDDGTIALFDLRFPVAPVLSVQSLQGRANKVQWASMHADLFTSGGADGTLSIWCARSSPMYCVGKAQMGAAISDLVPLPRSSRHRPSWMAITASGELVTYGLSDDGTAALAPSKFDKNANNNASSTSTISAAAGVIPPNVADDMKRREREVEMLLYNRRIEEAYSAGLDCARSREVWKDHRQALQLLSRVSTIAKVEPVSAALAAAAANQEENDRDERTNALLHATARTRFHQELALYSESIPSTIATDLLSCVDEHAEQLQSTMDSVRAGQAVETQDVEGLKSVLSRVLATPEYFQDLMEISHSVKDAFVALVSLHYDGAVELMMEFIEEGILAAAEDDEDEEESSDDSSSSDDEDSDDQETAIDHAKSLRKTKRAAGSVKQKRVKDVPPAAAWVLRALVPHILTPHVTEGLVLRSISRRGQKLLEKHRDAFLNNPQEMIRSLPLQLELQKYYREHVLMKPGGDSNKAGAALSSTSSSSPAASKYLLSKVVDYQRDQTQNSKGIFGWISSHAILAYLHLLVDKPNYAGFFWSAAELADRFNGFPFADSIHAVVTESLHNLGAVGRQLTAKIDAILTEKENQASNAASRHAQYSSLSTNNAQKKNLVAFHHEVESVLTHTHSYVLTLCRATIQCENILSDSGMDAPPKMVGSAVDGMADVLDEVLGAWSDLLNEVVVADRILLLSCKDIVETFCGDVEELSDIVVNTGSDGDEVLASILDECDEFLDIAEAKA